MGKGRVVLITGPGRGMGACPGARFLSGQMRNVGDGKDVL
jgi:hypothetical protein